MPSLINSISLVLIVLSRARCQQAFVSNSSGQGVSEDWPPEQRRVFLDAYKSADSTIFQHNITFRSYQFPRNDERSPLVAPPSNGTRNWTLQLKTNQIIQGQTTIDNLVYSAELGDDSPIPSANESDWQLCSAVMTPEEGGFGFPDEVNALTAPNDGDCIPYLGEDCYNAYWMRLRQIFTPREDGQCQDLPRLNETGPCRLRLGAFNDTWSSRSLHDVMDDEVVTIPQDRSLEYDSLPYLNITSDDAIPQMPQGGLKTHQPIAFERAVWQDEFDNTEQFGSAVRFVVLWSTVSQNYLDRLGIDNNALPQANVRLLCMRPNSSAVGAASEKENNDSSASSLRRSLLNAMPITVLCSAVLLLM